MPASASETPPESETPPATESVSQPEAASTPGDGATVVDRAPNRGPAQSRESAPPAGPPDDATTTYEDLPADLFGEPEPPPASDALASEPNDSTPPVSAPAGSEPRSAARERAEAARPDERPHAHDPAIDMVQTLFPGRIVALEPVADDPEGPAADGDVGGAGPDDSVDGGPDDGADRHSG